MNNPIFLYSILLILFAMDVTTMNPIDLNLDDYRWENRVVLIFSENQQKSTYQRQLDEFSDDMAGMESRELIVVSVFEDGESNIDGRAITKSSAKKLREIYFEDSGSYTFILIGKDGGVKIRSEKLVPKKTLFSRIDSMPMRQQEMKNRGNDSKSNSRNLLMG